MCLLQEVPRPAFQHHTRRPVILRVHPGPHHSVDLNLVSDKPDASILFGNCFSPLTPPPVCTESVCDGDIGSTVILSL